MADYHGYSLVLYTAAFLAGLVDAIGGGGGLIQLPALFSTYPGITAATLFGTNKLAGLWGTSFAAANFAKRISLPWTTVLPAAITAFTMAFIGAFSVTHFSTALVRKFLPFALVLIAVYTFQKKELGSTHKFLQTRSKSLVAIGMGGCIGFYDGFFGPGTGSFLMFSYVYFFGFDFLRASAAAKIVNVACNLAALIWFSCSGHILLKVGLLMALFNICGSIAGSWIAVTRGAYFVRKIFLIAVCLLIFKTSKDAFFIQ